jgi:hypothetical protein
VGFESDIAAKEFFIVNSVGAGRNERDLKRASSAKPNIFQPIVELLKSFSSLLTNKLLRWLRKESLQSCLTLLHYYEFYVYIYINI